MTPFHRRAKLSDKIHSQTTWTKCPFGLTWLVLFWRILLMKRLRYSTGTHRDAGEIILRPQLGVLLFFPLCNPLYLHKLSAHFPSILGAAPCFVLFFRDGYFFLRIRDTLQSLPRVVK